MAEYKNNSNKARLKETQELKQPPEKAERIVETAVSVRKKGLMAQMVSTLFDQDIKDVKTSLIQDVILPTVLDSLYDVLQSSVAVIFGRAPTRGNSRSGSSSRINYGNYYKVTGSTSSSSRRRDEVQRDRFDYNDVVFSSFKDADNVLQSMLDFIETYDAISVARFKDKVGLISTHADVNYGWTNLGSTKIKPVPGGYILTLPPAEPLD